MQNYVKYGIFILYFANLERMSTMETTFTSVYYETSEEDAKARLAKLRKTDKYPEIKAYILKEGDEWRVLRKILINLDSKTNPRR